MSPMKKTRLDEAPPAPLGGEHRRDLGEALGATDVALMYYELDPGERFSGGYHTHHDQEELFYILEGEAEFRTEEGGVTLGAGEALRFAPGEFQTGYNHRESDDVVRALVLGAPPGMEENVSVFECPNCGEEAKHDVNLDEATGGGSTTCRECGFEMDLETSVERDE